MNDRPAPKPPIRPPPGAPIEISDDEVKRIMTEPEYADAIVEVARRLGDALRVIEVGPGELRWLLEDLAQAARAGDVNRAKLFLPKLAFVSGKASFGRRELRGLHEVMRKMLSAATSENLGRIRDFFEAVVAYHRFAGGRP